MAGPPNMSVIDGTQPPFADGGQIPEGESSLVFAENVAGLVVNMTSHPDGGLEAVRGPCPLIHDMGGGYPAPGRPHGLFSVRLREKSLLFVRGGSTMWTFNGGDPTTPIAACVNEAGAIVQGISNEARPRAPDQFVRFNNLIIWCNGVDRARIINSSEMVYPLGFDAAPSPPTVIGPESPDESEKQSYYENSQGYSWHGDIGSEGDVLHNGSGKLLTSTHLYACQMEDYYGNLSPLSSVSNPLIIRSIRSLPYDILSGASAVDPTRTTAELDDLLRAAVVHMTGGRPRHAKAIRVGRTADVRRNPNDMRLLRRIPGRGSVVLPDEIDDGRLGDVMEDMAPVPVFRYMVRHGNRLVIANTVSDPAIVMRSAENFPGMFPVRDWTTPDDAAGEITGLISHAGFLIAGTAQSLVDITGDNFVQPRTMTRYVGIGAQRSVQSLPDGSLIWLGADGHFYRMEVGGGGAPQSYQLEDISQNIRMLVSEGLNQTRLSLAASVVHPITGQYLCAVPSAGSATNDFILAYSLRGGWSRYDYGFAIHDLCLRGDGVPGILAAATVAGNGLILDMLGETHDFNPPDRTAIYRSRWLRMHPYGLGRFSVRTLWVGFIDSYVDDLDILFRQNWSSQVVHTQSLRAVGQPFGAVAAGLTGAGDDQGAPYAAGSVRLGIDFTRDRRVTWRKIPVNLGDVAAFSFEIRADYPKSLRLVSFAFDATATTAAPQERWPGATDE